jgi:hypothetical protein
MQLGCSIFYYIKSLIGAKEGKAVERVKQDFISFSVYPALCANH